ncbi:MFS monocarboxylate transporter [Xylaria bambusicola]|uniref:MFS monocarboxylate transporter n=1 Tax=Xylaria bambusicola TaxID=326684 RepID=UPI002008208B|nr:MFS monocarboxylate transporter [Xylaria bambusicola]KAI0506270.1 MFS monocarboxylate transporter [Xylaria bambusicola]
METPDTRNLSEKQSLEAQDSDGNGSTSEGNTSSIESRSKRKWNIFPPPPVKEPGPPPDGGLRAWLQVLAGHLVCFVTWGLITSFGVFQSHYEELLHVSPSTVSWIGTIQIFILLAIGTFSGRASDAGFVHQAVLLGTVLIVFGMFVTSAATQYYQFILAQGVVIGIGMGILYMPGLSVPSSYFKEKKPLAVAIVASGAGSGGLVYPAMIQQLLPRVGFGWTIRSMAFVTLFISIFINLLLRVRVPARKSGPIAELGAFKELDYVFFIIGFFLIYWAVYFAIYYIDLYGHTYASFTSLDSINLLLITNALGIPGRILPGFIATYYLGPINTAIPTATVVAIVLFLWPVVAHEKIPLYVFAAAYGFVASAIQSLFAVGLAALTTDLSRLGTRMGMVFSVVAFASLTGVPIAGAIIEASGGRYLGAQLWAASITLLGAVALLVARVSKVGWARTKI